jgi:uncharacterized protein (DUF2236 family)
MRSAARLAPRYLSPMSVAEARPGAQAVDWELPGPDSLIWRVNSEAVLLLGGGRALILQVAHPQVAAGVRQFSDYREDPWGRIRRTIDVTMKITFGDPATSRAAAETLRRRHGQVKGLDGDGRPYRALDPELLMWVQATLIDTSLVLYERYVGRLTEREKASYYQECRALGPAYGLTCGHQPADLADFRAYFEGMLSSRVRTTDTLRDVADAVLNPPLPLIARPAVELLRLVTAGTLPDSLRAELGLTWDRPREALLSASGATVRGLMPLLPSLLRRLPPARAAARRATGGRLRAAREDGR